AEELSFRHGKSVSESYRIDGFRDARLSWLLLNGLDDYSLIRRWCRRKFLPRRPGLADAVIRVVVMGVARWCIHISIGPSLGSARPQFKCLVLRVNPNSVLVPEDDFVARVASEIQYGGAQVGV